MEGDSPVVTPLQSHQAASHTCSLCYKRKPDQRFLKCRHSVCLTCLENLDDDTAITCPVCGDVTRLPEGQSYTQLPLAMMAQSSPPPKISKTFKLPCFASFITIDEQNQWLLIATDNLSQPIQIYSLQGDYLGSVGENVISGSGPSVTKDTKRNLIVANTHDRLATFDPSGKCMNIFESPQFMNLQGLNYSCTTDKYLVTDIEKRCVFIIEPDSGEISNGFDTSGKGEDKPNKCYGVASNKNPTGEDWLVVSDRNNNTIKFYTPDGDLLGQIGSAGEKKGRLNNVTVDGVGRALVVDGSRRVVRVGWNDWTGQWDSFLPPGTFGANTAHALDVGCDGTLVVATYCRVGDLNTVESTIYILNGYC